MPLISDRYFENGFEALVVVKNHEELNLVNDSGYNFGRPMCDQGITRILLLQGSHPISQE